MIGIKWKYFIELKIVSSTIQALGVLKEMWKKYFIGKFLTTIMIKQYLSFSWIFFQEFFHFVFTHLQKNESKYWKTLSCPVYLYNKVWKNIMESHIVVTEWRSKFFKSNVFFLFWFCIQRKKMILSANQIERIQRKHLFGA